MITNKDIQVAKMGMNTDSHPSSLSEATYTYARNSNIRDESGNGMVFIQNEHSNILCNRFPEGYKVIGLKRDPNRDKVYFFITNPETGLSEIGFIEGTEYITNETDIEKKCGCDIKNILSEALEEVEQIPYCTYEKIIGDCEGNSCLNFNINYPIHRVVIKDETCGLTLYWTDNLNPIRYINLDDLNPYYVEGYPTCDEDEVTTCFDCDKLRIFKNYNKPCIVPVVEQVGGSLRAGTYEFLLAYCDVNGIEKSQYYSITNPISIFDENRKILEQNELNYITSKAIRLEALNVDQSQFEYYKVAVIQKTGINGEVIYYEEGIHPTSDTTIIYSDDIDKVQTTLNKLSIIKPYYEKAGMITTSGGRLLLGELTSPRKLNLQPIANLLGAFMRWVTVESTEQIYQNGINTSLYKGYLRDENYPLAIRFYRSNGQFTPTYPLVNRPATSQEMAMVNSESLDITSIRDNAPVCSETERVFNWQFYNYATHITSGSEYTEFEAKKADQKYSINESNIDITCKPVLDKFGKFGYYESIEEYPDNDQFDSSGLVIKPAEVPSSIKAEFESYFSSGIDSEGNYILNENTNNKCKPIKLYKFPDNELAPFINSSSEISWFQDSKVYPIGMKIDANTVNYFLDLAVKNRLITQEERDDITEFEILRGDRSVNKSIIAKGLLYDMYAYQEDLQDQKTLYYPNYPFNDLGDDKLHYTDESRTTFIPHPFGGTKNNKFSFLSPDTTFYSPSLPSEMKVEGVLGGKSATTFMEVEKHPKGVILGADAYTLAYLLGGLEAAFEAISLYGQYRTQYAIGGNRTVKGTWEGDASSFSAFNIGITGASNSVPGTLTPGGSYSNLPGTGGAETKGSGKYNGTDVNDDKVSGAEAAAMYAEFFRQSSTKAGEYAYRWLEIFRDNGTPYNFAYYQTAYGKYNYFEGEFKDEHQLRGLLIKNYIEPVINNVITPGGGNGLRINNLDREESVYLDLGDEGYALEYPSSLVLKDTSRIDTFGSDLVEVPQEGNDSDTGTRQISEGRSDEFIRDVASLYVSLKNYVPNQYGSIGGVKWLSTGQCLYLKDTAYNFEEIFGGDIFISRMSLKRKLPHFITNFLGIADRTPFNYYAYRNIGHPRYYLDYEVTQMNQLVPDFADFLGDVLGGILDVVFDLTGIGVPFPTFRSYYNLDSINYGESGNVGSITGDDLYVIPASRFYLFNYGIPYFLVESEINLNLRYGGVEPRHNFYPNVDYVDWTQENRVSIKERNNYRYNRTYSKGVTSFGQEILPLSYSPEKWDCYSYYPNGVIGSLEDRTEGDIVDPWLNYRPLDFKEMSTSNGKLIDIYGIESSQLLVRYDNTYEIHNAIDILAERLTPETAEIGTGGFLQGRPLQQKQTDLGYHGTQHKSLVSCQYGHFWADAKRGQVFRLDSNGQQLQEITEGKSTWFKEHLPFKILRDIPSLKDIDLDNHFKGLGISMGWDAKYERVFLTKKDYTTKKDIFYCEGEFYSEDEKQQLITQYEGQEYEYIGFEDCKLKFKKETQSLTNITDIYAFVDTTSMQFSDGQAASDSLKQWFQNYKLENPNYVGNLYILPMISERYLSYPKLVYDGTIPLNPGWTSLQELPPNLNTEDWIPPTDLIVLAFVDETNSEYHGSAVLGGFENPTQPTDKYNQDYTEFLNVMSNYNYFRGVLYPIVRDVDLEGGALILQAMAAFHSRILTQSEIDSKNTTVDVSLLLTENPYSIYTGLNNLNWKAKYDKLSPASEVFSSSQFAEDLDDLLLSDSTNSEEIEVELTKLSLTDQEYFEDASFTMAFSVETGSWISYYDFKPNYYIPYENYFKTGVNYSSEDSELGLWAHLLTNRSYQVFYGKRYPWEIEVPTKNEYVNKLYHSTEYWLDSRRYHNTYDFAENRQIGFDEAYIYNHSNNSGKLDLILEEKNKPFLRRKYNKINSNKDGTSILVTEQDKKWTFNWVFNRVRDELNNVPIWNWDNNQIHKTINNKALSFNLKWKDRIRGDWFLTLFKSNKESRFKKIFKWGINNNSKYK